jgi:hypothetical protein
VKQAVLLVAVGGVHLLVTLLPGVAAVLVTARRGVQRPVLLAMTGLAVVGLVGYSSYWAWFAAPALGRAWTWTVLAVAVGAIIVARAELRRPAVRPLVTVAALWVSGTFFVLFLGFLHGGTEHPLSIPVDRFSNPLPIDNLLPLSFANAIAANGHDGPPLHIGDWLSSDRPPLQSGFVLAQREVAWDTVGLHYQVLGVVLQQLWIVALWACLVAARVRRWTLVLVLIAALVSDAAVVNGFFVWPKLLAATFVLACIAVVLDVRGTASDRASVAVLVGILGTLGYLSHGATAFAAVPVIGLVLVRLRPRWRWWAASAVAAALVMSPWLAYQHWVDPPGNRLIKWQLAGAPEIDSRGSVETIVDSYRTTGWRTVLEFKKDNVETLFGGPHVWSDSHSILHQASGGRWREAVAQSRSQRFYYFLPSLGVLLLGPVAMLLLYRRRRGEGEADWQVAATFLSLAAVCCVVWVALMWAPGSAVLHQGTAALSLWAIGGAVAGLCAVSPRTAVIVVALHIATVLALYLPVLNPLPGTQFSWVALAAVFATSGAFAWIASRTPPERTEPLIGTQATADPLAERVG